MKKNFFLFLFCSFLFQSCASQSKTHLVEDSVQIVMKQKLDYYLYYPEDYETSPEKKFPILLFLHGGGESGASLGALKKNGPPKLIVQGKQFPFLILAPQNPYQKKWWNTRAVNQLLDTVIATHRIDKNRVYITGLSRGGGAAWEMAVQYPKKFAAMAVVCAMTPLPYAAWLDKEMPIWVFHGEEDKSVPISESITMVERLNEMGYNVQFTRYPNVGHNAWVKAYATEELYTWFTQQARKDETKTSKTVIN